MQPPCQREARADHGDFPQHPDPVEENFRTADGVRIKGYFHKSANPLPSKGVVILLYEPGVGNSMSKPGDWDGLTKTLLDGQQAITAKTTR